MKPTPSWSSLSSWLSLSPWSSSPLDLNISGVGVNSCCRKARRTWAPIGGWDFASTGSPGDGDDDVYSGFIDDDAGVADEDANDDGNADDHDGDLPRCDKPDIVHGSDRVQEQLEAFLVVRGGEPGERWVNMGWYMCSYSENDNMGCEPGWKHVFTLTNVFNDKFLDIYLAV